MLTGSILVLALVSYVAAAVHAVLKKELIYKPDPDPDLVNADHRYISGPESKLANLLTVLCLGVYRFYAVPQGFKRIVTLFGKFEYVSEPGLHGCWSFWNLYHVPSAPIVVKEQVKPYEKQMVYTKDGNACEVSMAVYFTICDVEKVAFAVQDYWIAVRSLVDSALRNECGDLPARELLASRKKLADQLRSQLDSGTAPWGIHVRLVEITNIKLNPKDKI